ncbi:MAG: type 1 glutamine amidotransferase [Actinobacteria bacterium]|nr:MAG: type 1 glutamine amidotransferase [Actinomycetota bacterium]
MEVRPVRLSGNRVAVLVANEFEDSELAEPVKAMESQGAEVVLIGLSAAAEQGLIGKHGLVVPADATIDEVNPDDFTALFIPGGRSPSHLRKDERVLQFVRRINQAQKPIGAICHGPQVLISSEAGRHHVMTGYPAIAEEFDNVGATYVDKEVVVDGNIVTSRRPADIPAFIEAFFDLIEKKAKEVAA